MLPVLKIAYNKIETKTAIKFLGVLLDENISWEQHIRTVELKLAKILDYYTAQSLVDLLKVYILHILIHT